MRSQLILSAHAEIAKENLWSFVLADAPSNSDGKYEAILSKEKAPSKSSTLLQVSTEVSSRLLKVLTKPYPIKLKKISFH